MGKLAIRGHKSRGKEVIGILEMLGGKNIHNYNGTFNECYAIDNDKICTIYTCVAQIDGFVIITLEEFIKKYPYKVGDKVVVKGLSEYPKSIHFMKWFDDNIHYSFDNETWFLPPALNPYKEKLIIPKFKVGDKVKSKHNKYTYEIFQVSDTHYTIIDIEYKCKYTEPISEDENWELFKEETMDRKYNVEEYLKVWEETEKGLEVVVNDRFELKEDNGKFYIIKKQPQYPKTYKECCDALGLCTMDNDAMGYKSMLIIKFQELLIARGAYWKIAGEQLGLGKPWEPSSEKLCYSIRRNAGKIEQVYCCGLSTTFEFPTEKMCNAFKENFETDLEIIKEFL